MSNQKDGLDYFPLDVNIELDDKFALIQAKHGIIGYGVIVKMFTKIYGDKGYYYDWNENTQLLFSSRAGVDFQKVIEIINDAIKWEIFDASMFEKYQILTSKRIQETFLEATKRRKNVEVLKHFLLVNGENVNLKRENVYILAENVDILKQSKVKESKVKESKEDCRQKDDKKEVKIPYEDIKNLYLSKCSLLPKIQELTDKRKSAINARWNKYHDLSVFEKLFDKAGRSRFLNGDNNNNWIATFDWLLNENNMIKVLEGNYDNKTKQEGRKLEKL